jgi:hypothetical protein
VRHHLVLGDGRMRGSMELPLLMKRPNVWNKSGKELGRKPGGTHEQGIVIDDEHLRALSVT